MKKIMFNDKYLLTESVLKGIKTQTRRIIKIKPEVLRKFQDEYYTASLDFLEGLDLIQAYFLNNPQKIPYKVGEVVAVAQSYRDCGYNEIALDRSPKDYKIIRGTLGESKGWNNKMFVRSEACKHQIRITNVRIERLQDISDEDCLKEGIQRMLTGCEYYQYSFYDNDKGLWNNYKTPREAFAYLINKVSRKDVWSENPYVFVYDFKLVG